MEEKINDREKLYHHRCDEVDSCWLFSRSCHTGAASTVFVGQGNGSWKRRKREKGLEVGGKSIHVSGAKAESRESREGKRVWRQWERRRYVVGRVGRWDFGLGKMKRGKGSGR
ncbi:hypothetical protein ACLOJK_029811 [Asimina triloba]